MATDADTSDADLVAHCRRWIAYRHRRQDFFDRDLFDECAWDMLLHLFIADLQGQPITDEHLVAEAGCSLPVGLRWMAHLEKEGDIDRRVGTGDTMLVTISDDARGRMRQLMTETLAELEQLSANAAN